MHLKLIHLISNTDAYCYQNKLVAPEAFCPREISAQEARFCTMTQFPPQPSQIPSQSQEWKSTVIPNPSNGKKMVREEMRGSSSNKKARLSENIDLNSPCLTGAQVSCPISHMGVSGGKNLKENDDAIEVVPDVAAAIEDLLEHTSKVKMVVQIISHYIEDYSLRCFLPAFVARLMIRILQRGHLAFKMYP